MEGEIWLNQEGTRTEKLITTDPGRTGKRLSLTVFDPDLRPKGAHGVTQTLLFTHSDR